MTITDIVYFQIFQAIPSASWPKRREVSTRCRCWLGSLSSRRIVHTVTPSSDTAQEQYLGRAKHSTRKHHQWISTVLLQHQLPPLISAVQVQHTSCIKGRRKDDDVSLPVLLLAWTQLGRPPFLMLPLLELSPCNCASLSTHIGFFICTCTRRLIQ